MERSGHLGVGIRDVVMVALVGLLMGAVVVAGWIAIQPSPCCGTRQPYVRLFREPLSRIEAVLAKGDGQAFAALAQDPLLRRPSVIEGDPAEFAYRAQRPAWGYLAWIASGGQPGLTGWVLAALTVVSCGLACGVAGVFLLQRGRSAFWALIVPLVGVEALVGLTPELLALALVGLGLLLWQRDRRLAAVVALSMASLCRETMLLAVAALACWQFFRLAGTVAERLPRLWALAVPFAVYGAWVGLLRWRTGNWPFNHSGARLSFAGIGLLRALDRTADPLPLAVWVILTAALAVGSVVLARDDVLTWVAVGFGLFASTLGPDVWDEFNFMRTLLPLYVFGAIALLGRAAPSEQKFGRHLEHDHADERPSRA